MCVDTYQLVLVLLVMSGNSWYNSTPAETTENTCVGVLDMGA